jgi:hypothetical protein
VAKPDLTKPPASGVVKPPELTTPTEPQPGGITIEAAKPLVHDDALSAYIKDIERIYGKSSKDQPVTPAK